MQLFAIDDKGNSTSALVATRKKDYLCPECHSPLRVRKGLSRLPHFYHMSLKSCRLGAKSAEHLQAQLLLQKTLAGSVLLEKPFPSLRRIADVVWEEKQIIFEVQCSAISLAEVRSRIADYTSAGFEVIFLLHDKTFNKILLSPAEKYLRHRTSFYTNINRLGTGTFYDQLETFSLRKRRSKSYPLPVSLATPKEKPLKPSHPYQEHLLTRWKATKWLFKGDIFDRELFLPVESPRTRTLAPLRFLKEKYEEGLSRLIQHIFSRERV